MLTYGSMDSPRFVVVRLTWQLDVLHDTHMGRKAKDDHIDMKAREEIRKICEEVLLRYEIMLDSHSGAHIIAKAIHLPRVLTALPSPDNLKKKPFVIDVDCLPLIERAAAAVPGKDREGILRH